jgi:hypothetical protein
VAVDLVELAVKVVMAVKQVFQEVQLITQVVAEAALPRLEAKVVKVAAVKEVKTAAVTAVKLTQAAAEAVLQFTVITIPVVLEEVVL